MRGLFLDPRTWKIDFVQSPFFCELEQKYGISLELHGDAFNIPKLGIPKGRYDFVLATEVWELSMQKTLEFLRNQGLKVFLVPREIAPNKSHIGIMFNYEKFKYKNSYYFTPDCVFAVNQTYADLWANKTKTEVIGYPRFDIYLRPDLWPSNKIIRQELGLGDKKILFFPSYPPYHVQTIDNKSITFDLEMDLHNTMEALEYIAHSQQEAQVVIKIHPMAQKCYNKKIGTGKEVSGLMEKYYKKPNSNIRVIGDNRNDSSIARKLMIVSDYLLGHTSTMMLEGIFLNKPMLHFELDQAKKVRDGINFKPYMRTANNKEEIKDNILRMMSCPQDFIATNGQRAITEYLYKIDGHFFDRLAEKIREHLA